MKQTTTVSGVWIYQRKPTSAKEFFGTAPSDNTSRRHFRVRQLAYVCYMLHQHWRTATYGGRDYFFRRGCAAVTLVGSSNIRLCPPKNCYKKLMLIKHYTLSHKTLYGVMTCLNCCLKYLVAEIMFKKNSFYYLPKNKSASSYTNNNSPTIQSLRPLCQVGSGCRHSGF